MNGCCMSRNWRPFVGGLAVFTLVLGGLVYGAPPDKGRIRAAVRGIPSLTEYPVAPPVHAYRTETVLMREGGGTLGLSYGPPDHGRRVVGQVATACTTAAECDDLDPCTTDTCESNVCVNTRVADCCRANSDCDDCDPCTTDICNVPQTDIIGVCTRTAAGACAVCSDGVFCNGSELCNDVPGSDGQLCRPAGFGPCDADPGKICDELGGPSRAGECVIPCTSDAEVDDGQGCNGTEICSFQECVGGTNAGTPCSMAGDPVCVGPGAFCGGVKRSINKPCGSTAGCRELVCDGGEKTGEPCTSDADCPDLPLDPGTCLLTPTCTIKGRCCTLDGGTGAIVCSRDSKIDCDTLGGDWLNIGDDPGTTFNEGSCDFLAPPGSPNEGEDFQCPSYQAGVIPEAGSPPGLLVGQVGAAACNNILELGDDYVLPWFTGAPDDDFLEVTTIRWVGGFQTDGIPGSASRIRVTFYDAGGNFIEDVITDPAFGGEIALRTVVFGEKPIVPAKGFMTIKAAVRFSPFGKHTWVTSPAPKVGSNDPNLMFLDGHAVATTAVPGLEDGLTPGILAFEIVGNRLAATQAKGACCNTSSATCVQDIKFICENRGDFFQGAEQPCAQCLNNGLINCTNDTDCPACVGGDNDGNFCDTASDCSAPADVCVGGGGGMNGTCSISLNPCNPDADCLGAVDGTCTGTSTCEQVPPACTGEACCVVDATMTPDPNDQDGDCVDKPLGDPNCPAGTLTRGQGTSCFSLTAPFEAEENLCVQPVLTGWDTCAEASLPGNIVVVTVPRPQDPPVQITFSGDNSQAKFFTPGTCSNDAATACVADSECPKTCTGGTNPGVACTLPADCLGGGTCDRGLCVGAVGDNNGLGDGTCQFGIFDPNGTSQDRGWWHSFSINACANVRMDFCGTNELYGETKQPAWANLWDDCDPCVGTLAAEIVGDPTVGGGVGTRTAAGDRGEPFCQRDDLWETFKNLPAGVYWYPVLSTPNGTRGKYQLHFTVAACQQAACCMPSSHCVTADETIVLDVNGAPTPCTDDTQCNTAAGDVCANCAVDNEPACDAVKGQWNGFGAIPSERNPIVSCGTPGVDSPCERGACCTGAGKCNDRSDPNVPCDPLSPSTCINAARCAANNGSFVGSGRCDNLINPCPSCLLNGETNCQLPTGDFSGLVYMSDLSASGANGITTADDFELSGADTTIRSICVWGTYLDPNAPDAVPDFDCTGSVTDLFRVRIFDDNNGLPGTMLGESLVTGSNIERGPEEGTVFEATYDAIMQGYTLKLDSPIGPLPSSQRLWLEVVNATFDPEDNTCVWHWAQHLPTDRDAYCAVGISPGGITGASEYVPGSARGGTDMAFCLSSRIASEFAMNDISIAPPVEQIAACWTCPDADNPDGVCSEDTLRACTNKGGTWDRETASCAGATRPLQDNDFCQGPVLMSLAGVPICGNGLVEAGEQCDDGGLCTGDDFTPCLSDTDCTVAGGICTPRKGDGCDDTCQLECLVEAPIGGGFKPISDGLEAWDTSCATQDGPPLVNGDLGEFGFDTDIWFCYTATCTGKLIADACGTQTGFTQDGFTNIDNAIGLYKDPLNPKKCTCPGPGGINLQDGAAADESCNGIADAGAGKLVRFTGKGDQWLIRVGGFEGSSGRGLLSVSCVSTLCTPSMPPALEMAPGLSGGNIESRKNRYLSFVGGNPGQQTAVKVTFKSLPPPWDAWSDPLKSPSNPMELFVQEPFVASEKGDRGLDRPCTTADPCGTERTFLAAKLGCTPFFTDWNALGVVHIFNEGIVPSELVNPAGPLGALALYEISEANVDCPVDNPASFGDPVLAQMSGWADKVDQTSSGEFVVPEPNPGPNPGGVQVFDTTAHLQKFAGLPNPALGGEPETVRMDIVGVGTSGLLLVPDGKITVSDLAFTLDAFSGDGYPFSPAGITRPDAGCP